MTANVTLRLGDCLDVMPTIPDESIDAIITDPPYPEISREYGRMTEKAWDAMMRRLTPECRRVLKPKGSAVFILQPNSERVGRMRTWLWEFMAWVGKEWGIVQDAWWWNTSTMPVGGCNQHGLLRPSLKACVWLGAPDCYREQDRVLLTESANNRRDRINRDFEREDCASRVRSETEGPRDDYRRMRTACVERGGTTPFNVIPMGSGGGGNGGSLGHGASAPFALADWWTRYISPEGGTILDPFAGSGTMGLAAIKRGRSFIGIERFPKYHAIASDRLSAALNARQSCPPI